MQIIKNLKLGFSRHLPVILQNETAECGLACLAMICGYYGHHIELSVMRNQFPITLKGATLKNLIDIAERFKLTTRAVRLEIDELKELSTPCVLHWDLNHFVVLKSVHKNHIVIHDPASGVHKITIKEVSNSFTGIALELWPLPNFEKKQKQSAVKLTQLIGKLQGLFPSVAKILLLALCIEVFTLLSPLYLQWSLDHVVVSKDQNLLTTLAIGFSLVALLRILTVGLREYLLMFLSSVATVQWQSNIFNHLIKLPLSYFEKRHIGDVTSRFRAIDNIRETLTSTFFSTVLDGIMSIATISMMLLYNKKLFIISFIVVVLYIALRIIWYYPIKKANEEAIIFSAKHDSNFLETVRGIKTIQLFNKQKTRTSIWQSMLLDKLNASLKIEKMQIFYKFCGNLLFGISNILITYFGVSMIIENQFTVGAFMAFLAYQNMFENRINQLINNFFSLKMLQIQSNRLSDIVLTSPEKVSENYSCTSNKPIGIKVQNLSFRYSEFEENIINDVSFSINAGDSVAIIGPSGCGKTTLLSILIGIHEPNSGSIFIDGKKATKADIVAAREHMGIVMQDDALFSGSIASNIAFFSDKIDFERVVYSARLAAVHEEIENMPMGYQTLVGDMGTAFSGGQKQRILLARALYRQPNILLLDEATSHLDITREKQVNQIINQIPVTRILIAHRIETILSADRIISLKNGFVEYDLTREEFLLMREKNE